jgi:signal transduction histidine kinase
LSQRRHDPGPGELSLPKRTALLAAASAIGAATIAAVSFVLFRRAGLSGMLAQQHALVGFATMSLLAVAGAVWHFIRRAIPPISRQADALQVARQQAEATASRQFEFLTHVHHELRTPLTKLVGATETLRHRGDELDHERREQIRELAYESALELHMVIESLAVSVEHALPGLASGVPSENWSSRLRGTAPTAE